MFSKSLIPILAAGLALAAQPVAAADAKPPEVDLLAMFQAICVEHQGDVEGAQAAAVAQGLVLRQENDPEIIGLYTPNSDSFTWFLMVSRLEAQVEGGELTSCAIQAIDKGHKFYKTMLAWPGAGLKGEKSAGHKVSFFYRETPQGRFALPDDGETLLKPYVEAGELRVLSTEYDKEGTSVTLVTGAPKK